MRLELKYLPVADLHTYHKNPRRGDIEAIKTSLVVNDQYKPIVVNVGTHTGRPMEVLGGNHTLKAMRDLGREEIAAVLVDVDEDAATRIVVADNRIGELGENDPDDLTELLSTLADLDGTGYTQAELEKMMEQEAADIDTGGDAGIDDMPATYGVIVMCDTEQQQTRLLEQLAEEGFNVKALVT